MIESATHVLIADTSRSEHDKNTKELLINELKASGVQITHQGYSLEINIGAADVQVVEEMVAKYHYVLYCLSKSVKS